MPEETRKPKSSRGSRRGVWTFIAGAGVGLALFLGQKLGIGGKNYAEEQSHANPDHHQPSVSVSGEAEQQEREEQNWRIDSTMEELGVTLEENSINTETTVQPPQPSIPDNVLEVAENSQRSPSTPDKESGCTFELERSCQDGADTYFLINVYVDEGGGQILIRQNASTTEFLTSSGGGPLSPNELLDQNDNPITLSPRVAQGLFGQNNSFPSQQGEISQGSPRDYTI